MPPPSAQRRAWVRTLEAHTYAIELMDRELRRDCGISLAWYDVLIKLWLAPDRQLRMAELADQVLLSRSWLTRRIVQLEQAGLVVRTTSADDGRGVLAVMTPLGVKTFTALERSHAASIDRHFARHLTTDEAHVVMDIFTRVSEAGRSALQQEP